jgi:hypothetical protein
LLARDELRTFAVRSRAAGHAGNHVRIFLSYRRDDTLTATGRLDDHPRREFGADAVFRDIDSIRLGSDFVEIIEKALAGSSVVLAVIGPRWLSSRLDNEDDFVRLEITAALRLNIPVIPVLVEGVGFPSCGRSRSGTGAWCRS